MQQSLKYSSQFNDPVIEKKAMKKLNICFALIILFSLFIIGCTGKRSAGKTSEADTLAVPDTGYTGIKKYFSKNILIKEVTFRNGVRHGEMKTYYKGGQLFQTFWYENGLREDTARWYYSEGQVFRSTPFRHDTIDGIQKQYYRNGRLKANIYYKNGHRTPQIEEYDYNGKLQNNYPEILFNIADNYKRDGRIRVNLQLSDNSRKVRFYRGSLTDGLFDTLKIKRINPVNGKYFLDLRKSGTVQSEYLDIIAVSITELGNNYIDTKKIMLPYKDLK